MTKNYDVTGYDPAFQEEEVEDCAYLAVCWPIAPLSCAVVMGQLSVEVNDEDGHEGSAYDIEVYSADVLMGDEAKIGAHNCPF